RGCYASVPGAARGAVGRPTGDSEGMGRSAAGATVCRASRGDLEGAAGSDDGAGGGASADRGAALAGNTLDEPTTGVRRVADRANGAWAGAGGVESVAVVPVRAAGSGAVLARGDRVGLERGMAGGMAGGAGGGNTSLTPWEMYCAEQCGKGRTLKVASEL